MGKADLTRSREAAKAESVAITTHLLLQARKQPTRDRAEKLAGMPWPAPMVLLYWHEPYALSALLLMRLIELRLGIGPLSFSDSLHPLKENGFILFCSGRPMLTHSGRVARSSIVRAASTLRGFAASREAKDSPSTSSGRTGFDGVAK